MAGLFMKIQSIRKTSKTVIFTTLALVAFAANSVLCRLALGADAIDASSFSVIRLLSGTLVLSAIVGLSRNSRRSSTRKSWLSSVLLLAYAFPFSFAYLTLDTGTGALILFGSVQTTMIVVSLVSGTRLHMTEWLGVSIAFAGFVFLVLPGVSTPSFAGLLLMTVAGIAWGVYTLKGRDSDSPLADTFKNFLGTIPIVLVVAVITVHSVRYSLEGIVLAILSGAVASGIGYTIWYTALGGLSATQAAVVQLSVPVIAALGGIVFLSEAITVRLTLSALMILGGILLVVVGRHYFVRLKGGQENR
jgi:drug/metabolite transporter (DMT)-like permease